MLDLKLIREESERVRAALARRGPGLDLMIDEVRELDRQWRAATTDAEAHRAAQKEASERVIAARRAGADASEWLERTKEMSAEVKTLNDQAARVRERLQ